MKRLIPPLLFALATLLAPRAALALSAAAAAPAEPAAAALAASASGAELAPAGRPADWAEPVDRAANLYRVTPGLYRSAALDGKDLAQIRALGVRTVVSLRSFHADTALLEHSGIRAVRVPINTWEVGDRHVVAALRAIRAAERDGPVLLHCQHGADRTGMMVAMYRMLYQDWSRARAVAELKQGGYGYHPMWKNIERYLARVDVDEIRRRVEAP
jgi:protein tyrosine/serine phosphatase